MNWRCLPKIARSKRQLAERDERAGYPPRLRILREVPEMKYVFIEKHQAEFSIKAMCRVLRRPPAAAGIRGVSGGQGKPSSAVPSALRQRCPRGFYPVKQRYGAPRLTDELRAQGYPFNVKTVAASLRRQGLRAKASLV